MCFLHPKKNRKDAFLAAPENTEVVVHLALFPPGFFPKPFQVSRSAIFRSAPLGPFYAMQLTGKFKTFHVPPMALPT